METDIKKILRRCLITVFSIFLIMIINAYLDRWLDMESVMMKNNVDVVPEKVYDPGTSYTNLYIQFPDGEEEEEVAR